MVFVDFGFIAGESSMKLLGVHRPTAWQLPVAFVVHLTIHGTRRHTCDIPHLRHMWGCLKILYPSLPHSILCFIIIVPVKEP